MGAGTITRGQVIIEHIARVDRAMADTKRLADRQKELGKNVDVLTATEDRLAKARLRASQAALDSALRNDQQVKKSTNFVVDQTSRMKKGIGFVTSAVGSLAAGFGLVGAAVSVVASIVDVFSSSSSDALRQVKEHAEELANAAEQRLRNIIALKNEAFESDILTRFSGNNSASVDIALQNIR